MICDGMFYMCMCFVYFYMLYQGEKDFQVDGLLLCDDVGMFDVMFVYL